MKITPLSLQPSFAVVLLMIVGLALGCSGKKITDQDAEAMAASKMGKYLQAFGLKESDLSEIQRIPKGGDKRYFVRFYRQQPDQIAIGAWVFADGRVEVHGEAPRGAH